MTTNLIQLLVAFRIYDVDDDNFIDDEDLSKILKLMAGENLTQEQLNKIIRKTIQEADRDGDGKLCFEEFKEVLQIW